MHTKLRTIILAALTTLASVVVVAPTASANACDIEDEGSGTCYFSCASTDNWVSVSASISTWYNQWRSIEGRAFCGGVLAAVCADHGDCQSSGYGKYGTGSCVIYTGQGVDFTGSCTANAGLYTSIARWLGMTTATTCDAGGCIDVPVQCIENTLEVACAAGMSEATLRTLYPNI